MYVTYVILTVSSVTMATKSISNDKVSNPKYVNHKTLDWIKILHNSTFQVIIEFHSPKNAHVRQIYCLSLNILKSTLLSIFKWPFYVF